jgi:radical SAM protein with 4Fe4S-binding SPASM domain
MKVSRKMLDKIITLPQLHEAGQKWNLVVAKWPSLQIDVTSRCNLGCGHCPRTLMDSTGDFPYPMFERLLEQYPTGALKEVTLGGWGEPLLHPHIGRFIRLAAGKAASVQVTSNATLLTRERAAELVECDLTSLCISLDAATRKTLSILRPRSEKFDVYGNIEGFLAANQGRGRPVSVALLFLLNQANASELDEVVAWGSRLKVNRIFISAVWLPYPGLPGSLPEVSREQFDQILNRFSPSKLKRLERGISRFLNHQDLTTTKMLLRRLVRHMKRNHTQILFKSRKVYGGPCQNLESSLFVSWKGYVYPCCSYAVYDRCRLADSPDELMEVWNGRKLKEFRNRYLGAELCRVCPDLHSSPDHVLR